MREVPQREFLIVALPVSGGRQKGTHGC
jgi:hypothetical protein